MQLNENKDYNVQVPVLDSLRAFAALSVCLFHFICTVIGFTSNKFLLTVFGYGHYGVQVFFVISGFIIPWAMFHGRYQIRNFFTFTAKRLIRLEPPYLVSLFIAILITYIRTMSPHYNGVDTTPTIKQTLLHFGYLIPFFEGEKWIRNIYWTLAIEFQYYITIGLLFPFIESRKTLIRVVVYAVFIFSPFIHGIAFLPYYLPVFLLGIILFLYKTKVIRDIELYVVSFLACASILWFHDVATLCFSLATYIVILKFQNFKSHLGDFFGKISYSLYLFHGLVGMTLLNYIVHITNSGTLKFLCLIAALILTIGFSYLVFWFVEKPSKKLSSAIRYKRPEEK